MDLQSSNDKVLLVRKDDITDSDIVLGQKNVERGAVYRQCLQEHWDAYESSNQFTKRKICKLCIEAMHERGVRFLVRVEDGPLCGTFLVEPQASEKIYKKVLRALRDEVNSQLSFLTKAEVKERKKQKISFEGNKKDKDAKKVSSEPEPNQAPAEKFLFKPVPEEPKQVTDEKATPDLQDNHPSSSVLFKDDMWINNLIDNCSDSEEDKEVANANTWQTIDKSIFDDGCSFLCSSRGAVSPDFASFTPLPMEQGITLGGETHVIESTPLKNKKRTLTNSEYTQMSNKLSSVAHDIKVAEQTALECEKKTGELWKQLFERFSNKQGKRDEHEH